MSSVARAYQIDIISPLMAPIPRMARVDRTPPIPMIERFDPTMRARWRGLALGVHPRFRGNRLALRLIVRVLMTSGMTWRDIVSDRRSGPTALARHCIMLIIKSTCKISIAQTGRMLGKDHTTVLHGLKSEKAKALCRDRFRRVGITI